MGAILFCYGNFKKMNKLGDLYIVELTDNKIDKAALRWMLLNQKNMPIFKDLTLQATKYLPFDLFFIDMGKFEQQISFLSHGNKYEENENPQDVESKLKLKYCGSGKPYFSDIDLKFSISHTVKTRMNNGDINADQSKKTIWGCAISDSEVGFDIQFVRPVKYREITERYFSESEQNFVRECGTDAFFKLWTRREALGKAVAEGFFLDDKDFSGTVGRDSQLLEEVEYQGTSLKLFTYKLADDLWASLCIVMNGVLYGQ